MILPRYQSRKQLQTKKPTHPSLMDFTEKTPKDTLLV